MVSGSRRFDARTSTTRVHIYPCQHKLSEGYTAQFVFREYVDSTSMYTFIKWICLRYPSTHRRKLILYPPKVYRGVQVFLLVTQSCLTLCNPRDCSLLGSSVHGILQARTLEWIAIPFSRGSSRSKDQTWIFCIAEGFSTI